MALSKELATECADWIAEQMSDFFDGLIAAELIDLVMEHETAVHAEHDDPEMDHRTMSERLVPKLEEAGVRIGPGSVTRELIEEILHWEDECLSMAGQPRNVRRAQP